VRHELYPDTVIQPGQQPRVIQIKIETTAYPEYPERACDADYTVPGPADGGGFACERLFVLNASPGLIGVTPTSVAYEGVQYWVPTDNREDKTTHVLSIVKQMLALNTSAKSLPQTNIISVISP
jgi:hypothetical protein